MRRKHIAIGTPSAGLHHSEMSRALAQLCMVSVFSCDISVLDGRHGSSVADGRNRLVLGAQAAEADALLFIDSDMVFPADGLVRLLRHEQEMVGATYARRAPPYDTFGTFDREHKSGCVPCDNIPTGFLLLAMSVFDKVVPPWFFEQYDWRARSATNIAGLLTEDIVFARRAKAGGVQPYVDLDLSFEMVHIGQQFIQIEKPE